MVVRHHNTHLSNNVLLKVYDHLDFSGYHFLEVFGIDRYPNQRTQV